MDCRDCLPLMDAEFDGELDLATGLALERHRAGCDACTADYAGRQALRDALRSKLPRYPIPPDLAARIAGAIAAERPPVPVWQRFLRFARLRWGQGISVAGGGLVAGLVAALLLVWVVPASGPAGSDDPLMREIVSSHVRSLMANHLTDVGSSDQHTVRPWFADKLPLAPPVRNLAEHGFELIGGRLDVIDEHPVAAVIYRHDRHFINLFVWAEGSKPPHSAGVRVRHGYSICHWAQGGFTFWAISDLEPNLLENFEQLLRQPI
jgi:anti-sigma factor RsiW